MIETIDTVGVRALHDRLGAREAGRLLVRCTREKPTRVALDELKRAGVMLSTRRGHACIWTALDGDGRTRISGPRLSMRGTWPDLPGTVEGALVGQPVTRLFSHPLLDEGMVVTALSVDEDRDTAELTLTGTAMPMRAALDRLRDGLRP